MNELPQEFFPHQNEIFGEGSATVLLELGLMYGLLDPESKKVLERFFDMLETALKMTFQKLGADQVDMIHQVEQQMDRLTESCELALKASDAHESAFRTGLCIHFSMELRRRGVSENEMDKLLENAYAHARYYAEVQAGETP